MNFIETLQNYFDKLPQTTVITHLWKEIIKGKKYEISQDHIIEYSFHYPVDTELYLEELNHKFDDCTKDELKTIEGNLKAYLQTFIYYCMISNDRISIRTALYAAELYLKIINLPPDIEKLYFEKNIYIVVLQVLNNVSQKQSLSDSHIMRILEYICNYSSKNEMPIDLVQGTANMYGNIIRFRVESDDDKLAKYSLECIKNLLGIKEHPKEIKHIMGSILRCLRSKACENISVNQRTLSVNASKLFVEEVMFKEFDPDKLQYFIDALFSIWGMPDFDLIGDCVDMINMLDEERYKELLRRIPNYLESKNHDKFYINLMKIIYEMLLKPHPGRFNKLGVLFSICFRDILMHLLNKKRQIQERTIEVLSKICLLENNSMMDSIFDAVNETGKFVTIEIVGVFRAVIKILENNKYTSSPIRNKSILNILSRILVSVNVVDGNIAAEIIYLVCKDGTPYSIKHILPNLHELYLKLSEKSEKHVRLAILRVFHKMAMHQDTSSVQFLEHLYNHTVFSSNLNGKRYGPECYSNLLLSDEFEYTIFMTKCRHLIKYDHVYHTIANLDFKEPGHCVLLNVLLEFIKYKEYNILTQYMLDNYEEICFVDNAGHLLTAFNKILVNSGVYTVEYFPKFDAIHSLLWDSLFKQLCGIINIKPTFVLIDKLKSILQLEDDEPQRSNLLTIASERAYRALSLNQFHQGSIMHLTEICISLKRAPPPQILTIFENVMDHPDTMTLLRTECKDTLIQLIAFFGTISMMNRSKIPIACKLFRVALEVEDPVVQLTAIKMYYNLCTEITHEFEDIIRFCLDHISTTHPVLSRVCILILEELIHDNYVLLNSEDFLRFVHRLGSYSLHDFMIHTLENRFKLSNKHDIGKFYMTTLVYLSGYTKFDNYPISSSFKDDLLVMRSLVDCPNDLIKFLFNSIQIKTRFNILKEMSSIFGVLVAGKCKVDLAFFQYFHYSLYTFKVMSGKIEFDYKLNYYGKVIKCIEKQILKKDPKFNELAFYGEYEADVRYCTLSLLDLLFFAKNEESMKDVFYPLFDVVLCWIDHVKSELVHYVHDQKGKEYDNMLKKLVHYYKTNKQRLENFINNQESSPLAVLVEAPS
ncbi:uncharacterized protein LOC115875072 [Sitophilus oryzae]|uniref:Uncharacterized protein LOC115875072 n=1 Tax=Sitophilus oryzae TaxID=7048 RepID=A0A6J2X5U3_SITOR|nr:uncharacterized protein LOC115875072 [Sitophilus oryzae]